MLYCIILSIATILVECDLISWAIKLNKAFSGDLKAFRSNFFWIGKEYKQKAPSQDNSLSLSLLSILFLHQLN